MIEAIVITVETEAAAPAPYAGENRVPRKELNETVRAPSFEPAALLAHFQEPIKQQSLCPLFYQT